MTYHSNKMTRLKEPVKVKKKIPSGIRDSCLSAFQKLRRLKEANDDGYVRCISCGKVIHWKEAQGGHYIPRSYRATELEEDNVNPQCEYCNLKLNGNTAMYRINLIKKIGIERVERLENMALAERGNQDAMEGLSMEDQFKVMRKKNGDYYLSRRKEYMKEINLERKP